MYFSGQKSLLAGALLAGSAMAVTVAAPVAAQGVRKPYTIEAQNLAAALRVVRRETGLNILYAPQAIAGKTTQGFRGDAEPETVLRAILQGTGLTYQYLSENAVAVMTVDIGPDSTPAPETATTPAPSRRPVAEAPGYVEEVIITGSRIARTGFETPVPTTVVDAPTIANSGFVNIADILEDFPAIGVGLGAANTFRSSDAGAAFVNLRGLGTNRSLTLINGRRRVSGSSTSSAVDINTIPAAMIERVEVITGGASAVYGADAVSGVVNIITRTDFDGLELSVNGGLSQHGGADNISAGFFGGTNFAEKRGYINFGAVYNSSGQLRARDRDFGQERVVSVGNPDNTGPGDGIPDRVTLRNFNDTYTTYDANFFIDGVTYTFGDNGLDTVTGEVVRPGPLGAVIGDVGATFLDWFELRAPTEVFSVRSDMRYIIGDSISFFAEGEFSATDSSNLTQYFRFDERGFWLSGNGGPRIQRDNLFLPDEVAALMDANALTELPVRRSFNDFGDLENRHERRTFSAVAGFDGALPNGWGWEASYQYGEYRDNITNTNLIIGENFLNAVDVVAGADGQPVCRSAAAQADGCVPYNLFARGPLTPEQRAYFVHDRIQNVRNTQETIVGQITGDLVTLPAGPLAFAAGAEHRIETLRTRDDGLSLAGEISFLGLANPRPPIDEQFDVTEGYVETRVPLLKDMPFAHALDLEGAFRYSDYDTIGGTTAWNIAANWSPHEDLRLRVSRARSVRAPNLVELFGPQNTSITNFIDPCDVTRVPENANRAANCAALGVPADFTDTFVGTLVTSGGNPDLREETSDTFSVGMVATPGFLPGLSLSVDYFMIDIEDAVSGFGATEIAERCVDAASIDNPFCEAITIGGDGSLSAINASIINVAEQTVSGIDFSVDYGFPLFAKGRMQLNLVGTYLLELERQADPSDPNTLVVDDGEIANPRMRMRFVTAYSQGPWSITMENDFISSAEIDAQAGPEAFDIPDVSARVYTDFIFGYDVDDRYRFNIGINNALDIEPPFSASSYLGGGPGQNGAVRYDNIGRFFFAGVQARF
ncbi:secretin/TonB-like protein [Eilatimonas milleporae]|uniref:Secretin/TonB-like protein n=2 Tax=Eilatimonas milleporae TaxID=911205 RepID=A0A3M0BSS8_9PROT|nr:secretin/TonB-like protein [Eilatimonas milleporae]